MPEPEVKKIICIPGYWVDKVEIYSGTNGALMIVANYLADNETERQYEVEVSLHDPKIKRSFEIAGKVTGVTNEFLQEVDKHKSVIYIIGKTGDFKELKLMAETAAKLLKVGGIGVKVETTGKAFEKDRWEALANAGLDENLYELFVLDSLLNEDGTVYSCGMHNLGLKDTIISGLDVEDALRVISIFNYYQVNDKPVIKSNHTFSNEGSSPRYIISDEFNQPYIGHELFENPFGMWRLTRE
jgi:hypothetical protein